MVMQQVWSVAQTALPPGSEDAADPISYIQWDPKNHSTELQGPETKPHPVLQITAFKK